MLNAAVQYRNGAKRGERKILHFFSHEQNRQSKGRKICLVYPLPCSSPPSTKRPLLHHHLLLPLLLHDDDE